MKNRYLTFTALLTLGTLTACKTSRDMVRGDREDDDPIKTVENPAVKNTGPSAAYSESTEELKRELAITQGDLESLRAQSLRDKEDLNKRIADLELEKQKLADENQKLKGTPVQDEETEKQSAESLWMDARKDLREGKIETGERNLRVLIKDYPKDKNVYPAMLLLGMAQYRLGQFKEAALTFNQSIDRFPKKPDITLAWFGQGAAFVQLKQGEDAKLFFEECIRRNPKSLEAREARKLMKKRAKAPADLFALFANFSSSSLNEPRRNGRSNLRN